MTSLPNVKKPCAQCPFRKDTLKGWLGAERMAEILEQQSFVCHKKQHLQCAGHMLINGDKNDFVRLAGRLNIELDLSHSKRVHRASRNLIVEWKYVANSQRADKRVKENASECTSWFRFA